MAIPQASGSNVRTCAHAAFVLLVWIVKPLANNGFDIIRAVAKGLVIVTEKSSGCPVCCAFHGADQARGFEIVDDGSSGTVVGVGSRKDLHAVADCCCGFPRTTLRLRHISGEVLVEGL